MKNDEIKQANRKALPKFLLFAVVCAIVGGVIGYYSGYGAAKGGMDELVGMMKETGAFFGEKGQRPAPPATVFRKSIVCRGGQ